MAIAKCYYTIVQVGSMLRLQGAEYGKLEVCYKTIKSNSYNTNMQKQNETCPEQLHKFDSIQHKQGNKK